MGGSQSSLSSHQVTSTDPAEPTREVRAMLLHRGLPVELVLDTMELAEYHPTVTTERTDTVTVNASQFEGGNYCSSLLYFVSPPLPSGKGGENWKAKKVVWVIEGHDQGWGEEVPGSSPPVALAMRRLLTHSLPMRIIPGIYDGASSWYEACIFRPRHGEDTADDLNFLSTHNLYRVPTDVQGKTRWDLADDGNTSTWVVQNNRVARSDLETHIVEWKAGEVMDSRYAREHGHGTGQGFLATLRPGDRVGLWLRAQYPGWSNTLARAAVHITYDVR